MKIRWSGMTFSGPYLITEFIPPARAAIYAIMRRPDIVNRPNTYQVLYFGETDNLCQRGFYKHHHKYNWWLQYVNSDSELSIAIHLMTMSARIERKQLEAHLIANHCPCCNEQYAISLMTS